MTYRYTINGIDVDPRGEWTISNDQNKGQIFFRRNLRGELTFKGVDYDLIMGMDDCDVLEFIIYCGVSVHWTGRFKFPYDFDIDEDSCSMVGTPEVVDEYNCIMDKYETEYRPVILGGGVQSIINDCAAGALHTLPFSVRLFATTVSGNTSYFDGIINGATMNCNLTLESSFMSRSDFPNGDNYAAAYGGNNYITGAANRLEYIFVLRNTSLRSSLGGTLCDGDDTITFKELEDLLRNWFNAYWFIDQNGSFRIEHIHFFDKDFPQSDFETGINLKTLIANVKESYAFRRNKYTYETGKLYDHELWTMQHYEGTEGGVAHDADFEGVPIFYGATVNQKSDCVPGEFKEKELATQKFWSDIDWAWGLRTNPPAAGGTSSPDTISCPGFCVLDVDVAGANHIRCEAEILGAVGNMMNRHLSIAKLQDYYHTWDRIFLDGDMNSGDVVLFDSEIRKQLQEPIEFQRCCDVEFNPLDFVETEMGSGRVKAATEKMRSIDIELLY